MWVCVCVRVVGGVLTVVAAGAGRARLRLRRAAAQRAVHRGAAAPIKSDVYMRYIVTGCATSSRRGGGLPSEVARAGNVLWAQD